MTKLAIVLTGTVLSGVLVVLPALAADKAPAPAAPAAKGAAPAGKEVPAAGAPSSAPSGPPTPAPEVEQLYKGFEGSWKCESSFPADAFGPGSPEMKAKSEVKIKKEPGGFWYKGEYKVKKTKTNPDLAATFLLGYDAAPSPPST